MNEIVHSLDDCTVLKFYVDTIKKGGGVGRGECGHFWLLKPENIAKVETL